MRSLALELLKSRKLAYRCEARVCRNALRTLYNVYNFAADTFRHATDYPTSGDVFSVYYSDAV